MTNMKVSNILLANNILQCSICPKVHIFRLITGWQAASLTKFSILNAMFLLYYDLLTAAHCLQERRIATALIMPAATGKPI